MDLKITTPEAYELREPRVGEIYSHELAWNQACIYMRLSDNGSGVPEMFQCVSLTGVDAGKIKSTIKGSKCYILEQTETWELRPKKKEI
jgi:hypothetical protein